jgi:hypothetical protein
LQFLIISVDPCMLATPPQVWVAVLSKKSLPVTSTNAPSIVIAAPDQPEWKYPHAPLIAPLPPTILFEKVQSVIVPDAYLIATPPPVVWA